MKNINDRIVKARIIVCAEMDDPSTYTVQAKVVLVTAE